jgi:hypothetical protein
MNAVARFLPTFIIAVGVLSLGAAAAPNPITIEQCFITVPKHMSIKASGTQITYVNNSSVAASRVVFAVRYHNSENNYIRDVMDVGTFAPGATVDHHFDLYNDVTYGGKAAKCTVQSVRFANGRHWP